MCAVVKIKLLCVSEIGKVQSLLVYVHMCTSLGPVLATAREESGSGIGVSVCVMGGHVDGREYGL